MPLTVIVGLDGSAASRAAVSHALDRAGEDGHVVVVHAAANTDEALQRGSELLDTLPGVDPRIDVRDVSTELVTTEPASALGAAARTHHADAIVVGTRGRGHAESLLGSVSHDLIHRAECPVTVIPERAAVRGRARVLA